MTVKLTQKLLENQRRGRKQSIVEVARKISQQMAKTTGDVGANSQRSLSKEAGGTQVTDIDEDEDPYGKKRANLDLGPPGFYDADLEKYYGKFDKSLAERREFKHRMRDKMSFSNTDWNRNVDSLSTTNGHRRSK